MMKETEGINQYLTELLLPFEVDLYGRRSIDDSLGAERRVKY
jgi:hypothetical protein